MAQQYLLPCPSCGAKTEVDSRQAGETIPCRCGQPLTVPTLRGLRELEPVQSAPAPAAPARKWSPLQGVLFSLGLLAALLAGGMAVRHFVAYFSVQDYTVDRTAEVDEDFDRLIDNMTITESMEAWEDLRKTRLGDDHLPPWLVAQQFSAAQLRAGAIWATIAGLGVAAVVAALLMGRGAKPAASH